MDHARAAELLCLLHEVELNNQSYRKEEIMTPRYAALRRNGYAEWLTCHQCGEIRSTTNPCRHWVIDRDSRHAASTRSLLAYGVVTILALIGLTGLIGLFVW